MLAFPGIFRGALDVRAPAITEEMKMAAARGIASIVPDEELRDDYIIPSVFNRDVAPAVAAAVGEQARLAGTAEAGLEVGYAQGDTVAPGAGGIGPRPRLRRKSPMPSLSPSRGERHDRPPPGRRGRSARAGRSRS